MSLRGINLPFLDVPHTLPAGPAAQVMPPQVYEEAFRRLEALPPSVRNVSVVLGVPPVYPKLEVCCPLLPFLPISHLT